MKTKSTIILALLLLATVSGMSLAQYTQHHQQGAKKMYTPKASKPGGMMGQGGMSMMQMMAMMEIMHPSIAVDDAALYVVRDNQVVKIDKNSLQVIATSTLPAPPASNMQANMGGMPGSGTSRPGYTGGTGGQTMMQRPEMQDMMNNMSQSPAGQFDQMFLQNMIGHHAVAIEMSKLTVKKATHWKLRHFAQGVIDSQSRQNKQFSIWLKDWYKAPVQPMTMPTDAAMVSRIKGLSGRNFEIRYMQMMIQHHQEAIDMSRMAEQKAAHPELKTAASKIVSAQSAEITELRNWLSTWYGLR